MTRIIEPLSLSAALLLLPYVVFSRSPSLHRPGPLSSPCPLNSYLAQPVSGMSTKIVFLKKRMATLRKKGKGKETSGLLGLGDTRDEEKMKKEIINYFVRPFFPCSFHIPDWDELR